MISQHSHRKDEHVSLAKKFHKEESEAGFDQLRFIPNALPETNEGQIDISTKISDIELSVPFYIEAMTGGSKNTKILNQELATIAKNTRIAMAVGSESIALEHPEEEASFSIVRETNPNGIVIANVSANSSIEQVNKAIDLVNADAVEIHINSVQETVMPEGKRDFDWIANIKKIVAECNKPVIVKEVGFGIDKVNLNKLKHAGVKLVNVGGKGGTNFAEIENFRRKNKDFYYLQDWGLTTVESLYEAQTVNSLTVIATGGITNPLEIVKSLYLGADAVGIASEILVSLIDNGVEKTEALIFNWIKGVKAIFMILGVKNIEELRKRKVVLTPQLISYLKQRKIK